MARLRVFVSSTYYDLKHIRASLEGFIESLGFDPILHEKGHVTYAPDVNLDESCEREVENADIYVVILGGRYGSESSDSKAKTGGVDTSDPQARYQSVTRKEFQKAIAQDIPVYILVEKPVMAELETYKRNRGNKEIKWAFVDSENIFEFIQEILSLQRNNPVQSFERFGDIEAWLREQWAGLFQELLRRRSVQAQFRTLEQQVGDLQEISTTLKAYMEEVVKKVDIGGAADLIAGEARRREQRQQFRSLRDDPVVRFFGAFGANPDWFLSQVVAARNLTDLGKLLSDEPIAKREFTSVRRSKGFRDDLNELRQKLGRPRFAEPRAREELG